MKTMKHRISLKRIIVLLFTLILFTITVCMGFTRQTDERVEELTENNVSLQSSTYTLGWTEKDNYSNISYTGLSVSGGYINEELFSFTAVDSTGATKRLVPVMGLDDDYNYYATGATTVTVTKIKSPLGGFKYSSDSLKLRDFAPITTLDSSVTIGKGKIFYRSSMQAHIGQWSYIDLDENGATLSFSTQFVQIAIAYEIYKGIPHIGKYYRIFGVYKFRINTNY